MHCTHKIFKTWKPSDLVNCWLDAPVMRAGKGSVNAVRRRRDTETLLLLLHDLESDLTTVSQRWDRCSTSSTAWGQSVLCSLLQIYCPAWAETVVLCSLWFAAIVSTGLTQDPSVSQPVNQPRRSAGGNRSTIFYKASVQEPVSYYLYWTKNHLSPESVDEAHRQFSCSLESGIRFFIVDIVCPL